MRRVLPVLCVLVLVGAACSKSADKKESGATKVTIKTAEYKFELPATFGGGLVEITLDNSTGGESHEAEMIRLDAGKTLQDLQTAMAAENAAPPAWMHAAGGSGPVLPGKTAVYTANLEAGTYAFVCHVPAADGKEHLEKGMAAQATVTAGTSGTLPAAAASLEATEFKFTGTETLKAGSQTVKFKNAGTQEHHIAMIALAPGKKLGDAMAFFGALFSGKPSSGPPPFTGFPGLVATMPPGFEGTRTLELTAGTTYAFACFIPDTDGTPHALKGMTAEITV